MQPIAHAKPAWIRQWLLEGGEITASVRPGSETLGIPVRPEGENGTVAWALKYNGAMVPDVFLRKAEPVAPELPKAALEPIVPRENPDITRWYTEDLEQAAMWINRKVRVSLSNGNIVDGRLASVTERQLEVAREVAGGEVAYPIAVRAITEFEVWRRGQAQ